MKTIALALGSLTTSLLMAACGGATSHGANVQSGDTLGGGDSDGGDSDAEADGGADGASSSDDNATAAPSTLVASAQFLTSLQVDSSSVYWADNTGAVWSVPLGGGSPVQLANTNTEDLGPSIAVDSNNVYVANGASVASVPIGGGTLTNLTTVQGFANAITIAGGSLFWATSNGGSSATINQMATQGGTVATLATNQMAPGFVATDSVNVYWGDIGLGTISYAPLAGGNVTTLATNQAGISGLAVHGSYVYWSNSAAQLGAPAGQNPPPPKLGDGTINRASIADGSTKVIAKAYYVSGIAADDSGVFWSDGYKNTISRTTLSGEKTTELVKDTISIGPVLDDKTIYYGALLGPPENTFTIRSIAK